MPHKAFEAPRQYCSLRTRGLRRPSRRGPRRPDKIEQPVQHVLPHPQGMPGRPNLELEAPELTAHFSRHRQRSHRPLSGKCRLSCSPARAGPASGPMRRDSRTATAGAPGMRIPSPLSIYVWLCAAHNPSNHVVQVYPSSDRLPDTRWAISSMALRSAAT